MAQTIWQRTAKPAASSEFWNSRYKELEYPSMMMPDHVPHHPGDPRGDQAFAFCYGCIRALIQAVDELA